MESGCSSVPQWKKDLIARLKNNQNKSSSSGSNHSSPHHSPAHRTVLQPNPTSKKNDSVPSDRSSRPATNYATDQRNVNTKMVQERAWVDKKPDHFPDNGYHKETDSDSSEELHYGPGIVKKLKNKYLSLALRESKNRPTILHMRKATSLENILDDEEEVKSRFNGVKNASSNRKYQHQPHKTNEMKRARSVETITGLDQNSTNLTLTTNTNRQSLLISVKEGNDYLYKDNLILTENKFSHRINRPKRLQPIMNDKEKPPVDFVKQAKMIFEKRPEQRTRAPPQTGEVAAKVDSFNSIIVKSKPRKPIFNKKIKQEEKFNSEFNGAIPDVSKITPSDQDRGKSLSETPDLILTSLNSPTLSEPSPKKLSSPLVSPSRIKPASPLISPIRISYELPNFDFAIPNKKSSPVNENVSETKVPTSEFLKIEVNGYEDPSCDRYSDVKVLQTEKSLEIEKNRINSKKSSAVVVRDDDDEGDGVSVEVVNKNLVPKRSIKHKERSMSNSNTAVFNFTSSKRDVPDYIANDKTRLPAKPELPKPGEGGIILIPGATILESFTDEDEEILRSLEGPPSPCDVTFINDNILIDGKSSLCQKSKRTKLKISFVEDGPDVYEYPSETSLMVDEPPVSSPAQIGHSVPNLSGSSLATYTPKSTETFQPGVTRSTPPVSAPKSVDVVQNEPNTESDETDRPFSSGANSDILF